MVGVGRSHLLFSVVVMGALSRSGGEIINLLGVIWVEHDVPTRKGVDVVPCAVGRVCGVMGQRRFGVGIGGGRMLHHRSDY